MLIDSLHTLYRRKVSAETHDKLRMIVYCTIGANAITGALIGNMDLPIDPHFIGMGVAAVVTAIWQFRPR